MTRADIPHVHGGALHLAGGAVIALDGAAWQAWLAEPSHGSFRFHAAAGSITARRERQRNGWYWYAYRRVGRRLHKAYLGRPQDVTSARLEAVAATLAAPEPPAAPAAVSAPSLLTTKLRAPITRAGMVARPRLVQKLAAGLRAPLTTVVAPPGFGKTTLVSAAARDIDGDDRPRWAWLSLDRSDNDPSRFWVYVAAALDSVHPGLLAPALALLQSPQAGQLALPAMLNALAAAPADLVLALDDYHVIEEPSIHELIAAAVDRLPANIHLVILSREDPPLPLARMRARGHLAEVRAADLRFTVDEASAFLGESMGLALPQPAVEALERRTEGWAAGLQLAALAMRERDSPARFIESFAGSHRAVADYLAEEVIDRQPEELQRFLLGTAVLERMCAELCDAVVQEGPSQAMLERLDRANLFVVPLDDERRWYRYHHLFGEMLRDRLRRHRPDLLRTLHRRAALWYRAEGLSTEAIGHALAAEDYQLAADMLEAAVGSVLWVLNEVRTLTRWLDAFPREFLRTRPRLLVAQMWAMLAQVQLDEVEQVLRALEAEPALEAETRGHIAATRSFMYRFAGDTPAAVAAAHHALEELPEDEVNVRSLVINNLQSTYMAIGDVRRAEAALASLDESGLPAYSFHSLSTMLGRSWIAQARGRLHEALALAERALRAMLDSDRAELPSTGMIHVVLAELCYERNQLERAERHARAALALGDRWWNNDVLLNANGVLGQIRLAQGDPEAGRLFGEMERLLLAYNAPGFRRQLACGKARAALLAGRMDEAMDWVETCGLAASDALGQVDAGEYIVLARALVSGGRAGEALPLLDELLRRAEEDEYAERQIELQKLRALAFDALGRAEAARAALARALELGQAGGYARTFLDEGPPLLRLIAGLLAAGDVTPAPLRSYARELVAAAADPAPAPRRSGDPDSLTPRELDVLRGLAAGLGNKQIAYQLGVELSTVRSHVKRIYEKLGASGRVQAVSLARASGLLDA